LLRWYLDEVVVYLFRTVVRRIKEHRSAGWPTTEGRLEKVYPPGPSWYPKTEVVYTYTVQGKRFTGVHTKAFWLESSAKDYAAKFETTRSLVVRYRLGEPTASLVRDPDQMNG
jgi:hypothetical protein